MPWPSPNPRPTEDQSRLALAVANLPSFARQYAARWSDTERMASRLGDADERVVSARASLSNMWQYINALDLWARACWSRAFELGYVIEPEPPQVRVGDPGLSGVGWGLAVVALAAVVAIALVVFVGVPLAAAGAIAAIPAALQWAVLIGTSGAAVVAVLATAGYALESVGSAGGVALGLGTLALAAGALYLLTRRRPARG